jgi:cytochrome c5
MPFAAPRPHRARARRTIAVLACLGALPALLPLAPLEAKAEPPALDARQTEVMGIICARCHARPGIGAPLLSNEGDWAALRKQGLETLTAHTVSGFGGMPALGTCSFCSERDIRTLVAWMAGLDLPARATEGPRPEDDQLERADAGQGAKP